MNNTTKNILMDLLKQKVSVYDKTWKGKPFEKARVFTTTEKGDVGEDFLAKMLVHFGYKNVEVVKGRRGHYDVSVNDAKKKILFEVKVATQDTKDQFQFNGIRYDTKYTHLFCLGITPEQAYYLIVEKRLLGEEGYGMTSMARGSNATFKLTRTIKQLKPLNDLEQDLKKIIK